jgi:transcriptional regulator with XRE-family HTH domain
MATTLATVEAREVLRCEHCSLVQFRTHDSHCRRCRKPLEVEEPEPRQLLSLIPEPNANPAQAPAAPPASVDVAKAVRELRQKRGLSQRELALRMDVPRTYISKIENGKATPTLSSLARLAKALEAEMGDLLHDARSRRQDVISTTLSDPFLAEILPYIAHMSAYQRSVFLSQVRDMATGRRKPMPA